MPLYDEICHTPLFIWDPRYGKKGERNDRLVQTIDLAPTLLDYFDVPIPKDMIGIPLGETIAENKPTRDYAIFGYHGAHVNITDGRYVYMHAPAERRNEPIYEYTLMPCHMRTMFAPEETATAEMHEGFSFTKGSRVMKIEASRGAQQFSSWHRYGDKLFDLENDPKEEQPLEDKETTLRLINGMLELMRENEAPAEQYIRLGLPQEGNMTMEMLDRRIAAGSEITVPKALSGLSFTKPAAEQIRVIMTLSANMEEEILKGMLSFFNSKGAGTIDTADVEEFAAKGFEGQTSPMVMQLLKLAARKD